MRVAVLLGGAALLLTLGLGGLTDGLSLNRDFRARLPEHAPGPTPRGSARGREPADELRALSAAGS